MSTQPTLDLHPLVTPDYEPGLTIQQRFDVWINANAQARWSR